jgi:hypothetical protein
MRGSLIVEIGDLRPLQRGDHGHVLLGPAEDHVESALASGVVDRAEVHADPAVDIGAVADAHDDEVAFVALHVLQVLDEEPDELAVVDPVYFRFVARCELGVDRRQFLQRGLDHVLLGLGEGDDADRQPLIAAEDDANHLGDVVGFGGVASIPVPTMLEVMEGDRTLQRFCGVGVGVGGVIGAELFERSCW